MHSIPIRLTVHGHSPHSQPPGCSHHTTSNLPSVGNQQLVKQGHLIHSWTRGISVSVPPVQWVRKKINTLIVCGCRSSFVNWSQLNNETQWTLLSRNLSLAYLWIALWRSKHAPMILCAAIVLKKKNLVERRLTIGGRGRANLNHLLSVFYNGWHSN